MRSFSAGHPSPGTLAISIKEASCSKAQSTPVKAAQLTKEAWHRAPHQTHPHLLPRAGAATRQASWPVAGRPGPSRRRQHRLAVGACSSGKARGCRRPFNVDS